MTATEGQEDFRHENDEISKVRIEAVGLRMARVSLAILPHEVEDNTLKIALGTFGEIRDIQPQICANAYRYRVSNGVGVVSMSLVKHIPSHVVVGRVQNAHIIKVAADNFLQLQRTRSSANCVPAQKAGAGGMQTGNHDIMGGCSGECAHFKHHDNIG